MQSQFKRKPLRPRNPNIPHEEPTSSVLSIFKAGIGIENKPPSTFTRPYSAMAHRTCSLLSKNEEFQSESPEYYHYKALKEIIEGRGQNISTLNESLLRFLVTFYRDRTGGEERQEIPKFLASRGISIPEPLVLWKDAIRVKSLSGLYAILGPSLTPFVESLLVYRKYGPPLLGHQTPSFNSNYKEWVKELGQWAPVEMSQSEGRSYLREAWPKINRHRSLAPEALVPIFCLNDKTWWTIPITYCVDVLFEHYQKCDNNKTCKLCCM